MLFLSYFMKVLVTQSCPTLCDPWTAAWQASLSITNSQSLLKLMSIKLVMPSNHLILCHHLLLLPSIFPSIRRGISSLHQVAKGLELQLQHQSFQWIFRVDFLLDWVLWSPCCPVQFSRSTVSLLRPHGLQHARPPCPSPTPRVYSNSCPLSRWCHSYINDVTLEKLHNL